jgi:hypothetical protein
MLMICGIALLMWGAVRCSAPLVVAGGSLAATFGIMSAIPLLGFHDRFPRLLGIYYVIYALAFIMVLLTTSVAEWVVARAGCGV